MPAAQRTFAQHQKGGERIHEKNNGPSTIATTVIEPIQID